MVATRRFWTARDNTKEAIDKRRSEAIARTTQQRALRKAEKEHQAQDQKRQPASAADSPDGFIAALKQPLLPIPKVDTDVAATESANALSRGQLAKAAKIADKEARSQRIKEHTEKVRDNKRKRFTTKKRLDLRTANGQLKLGAVSQMMLQKLTKMRPAKSQ